MWANLIQNNIESFSGNHLMQIDENHEEKKIVSRNKFVKFDNRFFIFTILS